MSEESFNIQVKDVSKLVEDYKAKHRVTYLESVIDVCAEHGIEIESLKKILSKSIKEKIEMEASERNLLKYKLKTIDSL